MKKKNKKLPIIIALVAVIAVVAVVVTIIVLNSGHRVIKVESFEGVVALVRDSKDTELVDGMSLKSEDIITTGVDGLIELLVDADKHILAREETCFNITTNGSAKEEKLFIELQYGSSLIEIENKLKDGASVEVSTPNAALSVRGTTFDVEYDKNENITAVAVADGVVNVETQTETADVSAGWVAIVKGDDIEVQELPIAYRNYTPFAVRYWSNLEYSYVYVKELLGMTYKDVEQYSTQNDGFISENMYVEYWLFTEEEMNSVIDYYGYEMAEYVNDDGVQVFSAARSYEDNVGYFYFKKIQEDLYLAVDVYITNAELASNSNIETYLPLTDNCYYVYDSSVEGGTAEHEDYDNESDRGEVTLGTMEVEAENSSQKVILTYNADYYEPKDGFYIQIEGILSEISKEYDCSHGYKSGAHVSFMVGKSAQEYYDETRVTYSERGWTLSDMSTAIVCGRNAYVFEEYWDTSGVVNKTHVVMELDGNVVIFYVSGGNVFNVDGYIVEIESFLIDMEVVE